MAVIALHNLCIAENDPCKSRWQLEVHQLDLMQRSLIREESKVKSNLNRMKVELAVDEPLLLACSVILF